MGPADAKDTVAEVIIMDLLVFLGLRHVLYLIVQIVIFVANVR